MAGSPITRWDGQGAYSSMNHRYVYVASFSSPPLANRRKRAEM
ncbi:hypothetical protein COLO4_02530 [Corchorus olitorius]|uniref:Uncharacterized protein n=1 Tax=Corchorus olitorius TaxID=93759 RepID=A0A1R3L0S6_9ROSI|nr:hypothetical protein COLO4_02530 [Corchorus olitorius]